MRLRKDGRPDGRARNGGARPGAGAPKRLQGAPPEGLGPELRATLDEPSGVALLTYCQAHGVDMSTAARELLVAWSESAAVRKAVTAWREAR